MIGESRIYMYRVIISQHFKKDYTTLQNTTVRNITLTSTTPLSTDSALDVRKGPQYTICNGIYAAYPG